MSALSIPPNCVVLAKVYAVIDHPFFICVLKIARTTAFIKGKSLPSFPYANNTIGEC